MLAHVKEHLGTIADLASVIGLAVSLVGFVATLLGVRKARRAAEEARQAAREVVLRIKSQLLSNEVEAAIRLVREVDRACRERDWEGAANSCDEARSRISQFPRDGRLTDQEKLFLDLSVKILGRLMPSFQQLRTSVGPKDISTARSGQIHEIITTLGKIYGRLQTVSLEV